MAESMSDHASTHESTSPAAGRPNAPLGADLLPPVEPPSAGFILQLFIVPALIVLVVVSVWLLFTWLVHRTSTQPEDLIQGLQGSSVARWQRASELAGMLSDKRYADFQNSSAAAAKLADILDREIDAAKSDEGMQDEAVTLRYFLCRALGEFRVADGLNVLLKVASTNRDPREEMVRRGAIQAIAVRAYNLAQLQPPQSLNDPELEPTLFGLAGDPDELVRSETAYTLGRIGTPACLERLEAMLGDSFADARYNAAVALAQHGNAKSLAVLAEMLDPDEMASVEQEKGADAQFFKRGLVMTSALDGVDKLVREHPDADFSAIAKAIVRIIHADDAELDRARIRRSIVARAQETLALLPASKT
jgi:HEAT repeat protein